MVSNFWLSIYSGYYRLSVDRPSVDQLLTDTSVKYRRTIGSVGEVSVNEKLFRPRHIWNDYRPCLERVSSDYRLSLDRLSTAISTDYQPTIDRVSTDYRPSVDRLSTTISNDRSVDTTYNKHDPTYQHGFFLISCLL